MRSGTITDKQTSQILMPNGKTMGGNPGYVWEDYIAGTDPTDTNSVFAASISVKRVNPFSKWSLGAEGNVPERWIVIYYCVYG